MKPNVLLVSNVFWTISRFRRNVVRRLVEHDVAVRCAAAFDGTERALAEVGADVSDLPLDRKALGPHGELRLVHALWRLLGRTPPQCALLYTIKPIVWGGLVCRARRIPYICIFTGLGSALGGSGTVTRAVRALAGMSARNAHMVVCLNERDARFVRTLIGRTQPRLPELLVLPGEGVDPAAYAPSARRDADTATVTFLFCSRILLDKGIDTFVLAAKQAAQRRAGLRFKIAGWLDEGNPSGLNRRALDALIGDAPIDYLGNLDEPRDAIAACSAVVLPTRYAEGVPRILLEAACMQKGLIASRVPGCTDVVIDGSTGWLVPAGDIDALAHAFVRFAALPADERSHVGRAAREHVIANFSDDVVWRHYRRMLGSLGLLETD